MNQQTNYEYVRYTSETATSLKIEWTSPILEQLKTGFEGYEIKGRCSESDCFERFGISKETEFTIRNLKSATNYEIKIYYLIDGDSTKLHEIRAQTKTSLVPELKEMSKKLPKPEHPSIYKLDAHTTIPLSPELRELHMFSEYKPLPISESILKEKTLLVLGATGTGKSTLVDAIINYVVDVPFRDDCRFRMVDLTDDDKKNSQLEAMSETSTVTCYRIPLKEGFNIDFRLNIVDTPGFADTRGKAFDARIIGMIETLFKKSITTIDAVCIVLPLSSNRLTEAQAYVFSKIVSLFAKNIENNIFAMITSDDGGEPHCLKALAAAKINVKYNFKFNNSDIFSKNPSQELWNTRAESFRNFFKTLECVEKQCLKDSQKVITTQLKLKAQLERVQEKIRMQVQTINNIRNEKAVMERYKVEIETNKDFEYKETIYVYERISCKTQSLNCSLCKKTCHPGCWVPFDFLKSMCEVIQKDKCIICKGKCLSKDHTREKYIYRLKYEEVCRTKMDLERKYNCAVAEKEKHKNLLEKEEASLMQSLKDMDSILDQALGWIRQLNDIALKPEHQTIESFVDEIIKIEVENKDPQYGKRIDMMTSMKAKRSNKKRLVDSMNELLQGE